jgi:hypothetical protein
LAAIWCDFCAYSWGNWGEIGGRTTGVAHCGLRVHPYVGGSEEKRFPCGGRQ